MTPFFYIHKKRIHDKRGYIYCKYKYQNKTYNRSLKLPPIPKSAWNKKKQRVNTYPELNHELYNKEIQNFTDLLLNKKSKVLLSENRQSFINFFKLYLEGPELEKRHGTRQKYNVVYKKLSSFIESEGKTNLKFEELELNYIHRFHSYMLSNKLSTDTATHYLKILRIIIKKAQKTKGYYDVYDPFVNFKFSRKTKKQKVALDAEMIKKLRSAKIESEKLKKARAKFLFQLFANGMRPSDLALLKYDNIKGGRIKYTMFKTKNEISLPLNANHISQLENFVNFDKPLHNWILYENQDYSQHFQSLTADYRKGQPICRTEKFESFKRYYSAITYSQLVAELETLAWAMKQEDEFNDYEDYNELYEHAELIKGIIDRIIKEYLKASIENLNKLALKNPNKLVFDLLQHDSFPSKDLTNEQYNYYKKRNIVYNRHLKVLSTVSSLPIKLNSSLARTSFASVLVNLPNVNTQLISGALGHGSIQVTQHYIAGFNTKIQDEVTDRFGSMFWG